MQHRFPGIHSFVAYRVAASLLCLAAVASAETMTYNARIGDEMRTATVAVTPVEGQPSVSLKGVVAAFGGQTTVSADTINVAMLDASALIMVGDTKVTASQEFTLQHPPRIQDNEVYIAASDVVSFFAYAFNLDVRSGAADAQPVDGTAPVVPAGRKLRVVIDAGHGGTDAGATGQTGTPEKAIARAIAERVGKLIETSCQPVYTRPEDNSPTAIERVSMTNVALKGDILVSIHVGASISPTASGFEFFCPMGTGDPVSSQGLILARSMSNAMLEATGGTSRGVRQAPCRIFTNLQKPGVLVEVGCITNPKEEPLLVDAAYQDKLAQGIANGIVAYAGGKTQ